MTYALPAAGLPSDRRAFLRQLTMLPLVGGAVTLIGEPMAVAEPATPDLLETYKTWLFREQQSLSWEMAADPVFQDRYFGAGLDQARLGQRIGGVFHVNNAAGKFHPSNRQKASDRAALVLSAVGCGWR